MNINVILFRNFETLDVFGPIEIFGRLNCINISYYSLDGGIITNGDNVQILTKSLDNIDIGKEDTVLFVPGGMGTRVEVNNEKLIAYLREIGLASKYVLSVCTGSALLAKSGLLDGKEATSNKRAFEWIVSTNSLVKWNSNARWVVDGKFYTSSGVSAGMDMALGFVADVFGMSEAETIAFEIEYIWNKNKRNDFWAR